MNGSGRRARLLQRTNPRSTRLLLPAACGVRSPRGFAERARPAQRHDTERAIVPRFADPRRLLVPLLEAETPRSTWERSTRKRAIACSRCASVSSANAG